MKRDFITVLILIVAALPSFGWGKVGHESIAYIAECNLTPAAKKTISKYLRGESIVYYASWLDKVRDSEEYGHTNGWHSASVDENGKHLLWHKRYRVSEGLIIELSKLADYKHMTDSAVEVGIKIVTHLVGDMHCPSHTFFRGKSQKIEFYLAPGKQQFHKFWDGDMLALGHVWTFREYREMLDRWTDEQKRQVAQGSLFDWIEENAALVAPVYEWIVPGKKYNKKEDQELRLKSIKLCEDQIRKAGYRLAHVLNTVFDPSYKGNLNKIMNIRE